MGEVMPDIVKIMVRMAQAGERLMLASGHLQWAYHRGEPPDDFTARAVAEAAKEAADAAADLRRLVPKPPPIRLGGRLLPRRERGRDGA